METKYHQNETKVSTLLKELEEAKKEGQQKDQKVSALLKELEEAKKRRPIER